MGLLDTVFPWEAKGRGVEVGGPPFLPKAPLPTVLPDLGCSGLTPGPKVKLFESTGGGGLHSGAALEVLGLVLGCGFFPLDVRTGTGGGDETGAPGEG